MYKDKSKANEAAKERMKRYRRNKKGVTTEGVTDKALPESVTIEPEVLGAWAKMAGYTPEAKDFHSLPADVQRSIMRISEDDEEVRSRTIIALDYQRKFPNSVHRGTGL